jgi:putative Holliday junction resolvase
MSGTGDASNVAGRVLAIDPGTKRTGLAMSDELGITAQGLETYTGSWQMLIEHVGRLAGEYGIISVVIGLPLSMSGVELEGARRSRELAAEIEKEYGIEVVLRDERMTSLEAERVMKQEGRIKNAGDIDRLSAVLLLQSYIEERGAR